MDSDSPALQEFDEMESGRVKAGTIRRYVVFALAVAWSVFQLVLPNITMSATYSRCTHLAFAIALAFLLYPANRKYLPGETSTGKQRPLWLTILLAPFTLLKLIGRGYCWVFAQLSRIPGLDYVVAAVAAALACYLAIFYEQISNRSGLPTQTDLIVGAALVFFLLEATRRCVGWALPLVAVTFIFLSFNGQSLGDFAFRNASLSSVVDKLALGSDGIYGVPLDVSTNIVFLYVLFGAILASAGGAQYFIQLAYSLVGFMKGGPAMSAVLASGLTGMVSGSSIANTVTTGTFTIPLMKKAGYSPVKAGAFEVAASTNGQLMPPVMGAAAFIMAEYCGMPYLEVVRAAAIPAIISYLALIYITYLEACKSDLPRVSRAEVPKFWDTLFSGFYYLIPIVVLIVQLFVFRRSAQMAAFWAIIFLIGIILIREIIRSIRTKDNFFLSLKTNLIEPLESGARNMISIGVAVAAAGIVAGIISLGLGSKIPEIIAEISQGSIYILLIVTAIFCLVLGMGLPTTANYIVIASLVAPTMVDQANAAGLALPLIAAHLFCFYFGILSDDTPPVGLSAYAASAISGADPIKTGLQGFGYDIRTAILPFLFVFNTDLILHNVTSVWYGALVFIVGLLAMLAFASLTRGWIRCKTSILEGIGLVVAILMMMLPNIFAEKIGMAKPAWIGCGVALAIVVWVINHLRSRKLVAN